MVSNLFVKKVMFSNLYPSVTSVICKLINCPEEDELTRLNRIEFNDNIIRISNNFGDKINPKYLAEYFSDTKKKKKTSNRIMAGIGEFAGTHFNSQTTYSVLETEDMFLKRKEFINSIPDEFKKDENLIKIKLFKIKHFTNGKIQIPGIIQEDLSDANTLIDLILNKLNTAYSRNDICLEQPLSSSMRNYKGMICLNKNQKINLNNVKNKLNFKYLDVVLEKYYINRIEINSEKTQGLSIRLFKPENGIEDFNTDSKKLKNDKIKSITIKVYQEGKINIDSVDNIAEADLLYKWMQTYFVEDAYYNIADDKSDYYTSDDDGFAVYKIANTCEINKDDIKINNLEESNNIVKTSNVEDKKITNLDESNQDKK